MERLFKKYSMYILSIIIIVCTTISLIMSSYYTSISTVKKDFYSLDLKEITNDDLKAFVNFLYTESVLANYEGEMWVRVYPKEAYDKAYNTDTDAAWNELDTKYLAGKIWIDSENALAEIYHPTKDELIERINFAK